MAKTIVLLSNLRIHSAEFFGGNYHIKCRAKQKSAGAAGAIHGSKGGRGNKRGENQIDEKKKPLTTILSQGVFSNDESPAPKKKREPLASELAAKETGGQWKLR